MVRGFYSLASGIITQNRVLDTVSNNIANSNTNGFKTDKVSTKTFGSMVVARMDGQKSNIGNATMFTTADQNITNFSQGPLQQTGRNLDFAIDGKGFFAVQTDGGTLYTRNGSFDIDGGGYLVLNGIGRVLGKNGQPIYLGTDNITSDTAGNIYVNGTKTADFGIYTFQNEQDLTRVGEGFYSINNPIALQNTAVVWKNVEGSNTDLAQELTDAISAQRNLQSCSQALKMYDQILDKATNDIGKV